LEVLMMSSKEVVQAARGMEDADRNVQAPAFVRHILAPTDLTPGATKTVDCAIAFARVAGARVTLLHVHDANLGPDYVVGRNDYSAEDAYRANAEKAMRQLRADFKGQETAIDICYRVGVPWEQVAIAATELEADLIIISTHNYKWFDHLLNGRDAERMVRSAPCPVLVVPERY
jgi:nucleotide-binding universal stress UspA family protein